MDTKKIVEDVAANIESAIVDEVTQKDCVCGEWSLRIFRTPKAPAPAISEVLPKGASMSPALGAPESV
jgi:hypothetical protein